MQSAVSVIICCHNSAKRLPSTLAHLASQNTTDNISWEVLVVDNASTDDTAHVAQTSWKKELPVPLRVVYESKKGLSYARYRGFIEAQYDLISFIDDDNWVCPDWLQTVAEIMSQQPEVGACGGCSEAASDIELPYWFKQFQDNYAVGQQAEIEGYVSATRGFLWGAGLTVRRQAWKQLYDQGFNPLLVGRQGNKLTACEDYEFCLALQLSGWQLWYDPRLQFRHYLPANRLDWSYLRRLKRGFGVSSLELDPYFLLLSANNSVFELYIKRNWYIRVAGTALKLLRYPRELLQFSKLFEGDPEILEVEILCGRLSQLLQGRKAYQQNFSAIWNATWRKLSKSA